MAFFRTIRDKVATNLGIIILAALLLVGAGVFEYCFTRKILQDELEERAEALLKAKASIIDHTLELAEHAMKEHLWDIQSHLEAPDSMFSVVRRFLVNNRQIEGACLSFVPGHDPGKPALFEPYAHRDGAAILVEDLVAGGHDYTPNPLYRRTVDSGEALWGDPYKYGEDGQRDLITYSYPVRDRNGKIVAACGLDIDLSWLGDTLNARQYYPSSFGLVLTKDGGLVAGSSGRLSGQKDVDRVLELVNDPTVVRQPVAQCERIDFRNRGRNRPGSIYLTSMDEAPYWQVLMVCYDDEVYAPARRMQLYRALMALAALLILFFILHRYALNAKKLSDAEVKQARIGSELHVARHIQREMLPKTFPPYPERSDLDIYGSLEPAREVGGDLFDFFIRDERLYFCIGDVSGKGIPSAMVMSVIHSLFRTFSERMGNPARIVEALNEELCRGNDSTMFVTFFLGILDLPSGRLHYCNAGHDRPILVRDGVTELPAKANLPVGVFNDTRYVAQECDLPAGATLFLYTDGLTEARNVRRELFTRDRILEALGLGPVGDSRKLLETVDKAVRRFIGEAEQSDDLTMLAIRYTPGTEQSILEDSLVIKNDAGQIGLLGDFMKSVSERLGLPSQPAHDLRLAVEEIVANVVNYAYPDQVEGDIRIDARSDGEEVRLTVTDSGIPFDPTGVEMADTSLSVEDRPIGGLGIFLARRLVDSINYLRRDGKNVLTLRKKISKI